MKDIKKHICPTCGGNLIVNVERQMYECPFCGGTFDYDYFREENVLGIAAQALANKEFTSAGRAYDFMLEKEPANFEALRGKALIAMDMTKIDDIQSIDRYSNINYKTACEEIDRAIESSNPKDSGYFTTMKDIVDAGHEYIDAKTQHETLKDERAKSIETLSELARERDTRFIYASSRIRPKKAVFLTILCYILLCLVLFGGYMLVTRNPYSKAEDLSKYETQQTEDSNDKNYIMPGGYNNNANDLVDGLSNYMRYQEALEREEQRKINYNNWEKSHPRSASRLVVLLGAGTFIYALIVFILFMGGRFINAERSKIHAKVDEQTEQMYSCDKKMSELKNRIKQGYNRLCEFRQ